MIKTYRKTATIKAERFDNSREMAKKYHVEYDGAYILPFRIETHNGWLGMKVGDWILTGVNDEYWPITNDVFSKTYAELPVIPKEVAYVIEEDNDDGDYKLGVAFYAAYEGALQPSVVNWILTHAEVFARAWLDGYVVEEDK
ncbi:DUF1642 domain-containing protein [Lactiplantibacillus plantarum]|uniref:DUF1642 domain-containing protein n=1 Tax=Lactiplantibacillus plantarum TaxID=1590 RepID=UPI00265A59AB|nr:DUF1642 domain-containing protein [Lactiplantibacillus plantarum]WKF80330.1 DUF1642 domain-containing protein [Lactiplantibacillus plantarum]